MNNIITAYFSYFNKVIDSLKNGMGPFIENSLYMPLIITVIGVACIAGIIYYFFTRWIYEK